MLIVEQCLPQRVFRSPQMPIINPYYSTYKMALLCVLYILQDAQFISAGANIIVEWPIILCPYLGGRLSDVSLYCIMYTLHVCVQCFFFFHWVRRTLHSPIVPT